MLIERLIIKQTNPSIRIIRDIPFNLQGLNLIVDKTSVKVEESGNNVGKTTLLNIIDLCFGAKSIKKLYYDVDTGTENKVVKDFLETYRIEAELHLVEKDNKKNKIVLTRELFTRGKKKINGRTLNKKDFEAELKSILFGCNDKFPTIRQLIPKFIRIDDLKPENMVRYLLHTSNETYDTIYLFLLDRGYKELLNKKDQICRKLKECENKIEIYSKDNDISSLDFLKQREMLIDDDIMQLNFRRKNLNYMEEYKEQLSQRRKLSVDIENLENNIEMLEFEVKVITNNILKLQNAKSDIKITKIKHIYQEAEVYLDKLSKKYEDVINFHNKMIENRINFIKKQLSIKNEDIKNLMEKRNNLLEEKKKISIDILDEGLLDELNCLNSKIEELNVQKGEVKQSIKILGKAQKERKKLENDLDEVNSKINPDTINDDNNLFNKYFAKYCEKLYGEKYLFTYDSEWRSKKGGFPVYLDSAYKGKMGAGMKKSLTVAFDFAYMMFASEKHFEGPEFIIHDKMESTHINQIKTIFQICKEIEGQYIVPILRERINEIDKNEIDNATILELSQSDKLFKI